MNLVLLAALSAGAELLAQDEVVWAKSPSAEELVALRPEAARRHEVRGGAVVTLSFDASGSIANCVVKTEPFLGVFGFGAAACAASALYRAEPTTRSGSPVAGRSADVTIVFPSPPPTDGARPRGPMRERVIFTRGPTSRDLGLHYPAAALISGRRGEATVILDFEESGGKPLSCGVIKEAPENAGFGRATCAALKSLRAAASPPGSGPYRYVFRLKWTVPR